MTHLPTDDEIRGQLAVVRERVLQAARDLPTEQSRARRRTITTVSAVGAALALSAGAIAFGVSQQDFDRNVMCYDDVDLDAASSLYVVDDGSGTVADRGAAVSPADVCALAWSSGDFDRRADRHDVRPGTFPVPPLAACTRADGVAAVFPNREDLPAEKLCGALGLAVWDPDSGV